MTDRLADLEPGTKRHQVLSCAVDFKRSWFELARHLVEVRDQNLFQEWGYRNFETYAQHELHLRKESVYKLVRSADFLRSHEHPVWQAAARAEPTSVLPSYQAIDILAEARQNPYLSDDDYRDIRDQVFREDPAPSLVRKALKERAPEPPRPPPEPDVRLRRCLGIAERLYGLMLEEDVPEGLNKSMEEVVGGLRKMLGE